MVKLTVDLLSRSLSNHTKRHSNESVEHYLNRLTHIYCQEKSIDEIVCTRLYISKYAVQRRILTFFFRETFRVADICRSFTFTITCSQKCLTSLLHATWLTCISRRTESNEWRTSSFFKNWRNCGFLSNVWRRKVRVWPFRYVGSNEITVVEGIQALKSLRELHVENQCLPPDTELVFDPRCLRALSVCYSNFNRNFVRYFAHLCWCNVIQQKNSPQVWFI